MFSVDKILIFYIWKANGCLVKTVTSRHGEDYSVFVALALVKKL